MDGGSLKLLDFCIPSYILHGDAPREELSSKPSCPVVVFINTKSGGQLGGELLRTYRDALNEAQVFDLGKVAPEKELQVLFGNLERLRQSGDRLAEHVIESLRLIVAGGDGTAGWLLGVVCDLNLKRPPPIATVPLGTGNNLPFSFGWGKRNPGTDRTSVEAFLNKVKGARPMEIDNWHITMKMKTTEEGSFEPIPPLQLPHSLHTFQHLSSLDASSEEGCHTFRGGFWNYFSIGMDAQVSYAFHSERKANPEKFKDQLANQRTYAKLGVKQGWFFPALVQDQSSNLSKLVQIQVVKRAEKMIWEELKIPESIRSIVCLNLPSFSGGLNPWGTPNKNKEKYKGLTPPFVDDGHIEIVGFKDAWRGLLLLAPKGHGTRLAQVHRIKFEFKKNVAKETYMRLDGEPWKQPLPENNDMVVIDISHHGQVTMLANGKCRSKSHRGDPSIHSVSSNYTFGDDSEENSEERRKFGADSEENSEERRKFGAANTFKMPEEIPISYFS